MATFHPRSIVVEDETDVEPIRFTLKWSIKNLTSMQETNGYMYSNGITMGELGMSEDNYGGRWRIGVKPSPSETAKYLHVYLCLTDKDLQSDCYNGKRKLRGYFQTRITTGKLLDVPVFASTELSDHIFSNLSTRWECDYAKEVAFLELSGVKEEVELLKDDCLNISIDVLLVNEVGTTGLSRVSQRHREFLGRQLKWREEGTDFLLIADDGKEFPVDRAFLMAHSPVFAAMLTHDSKEKQTSRCEMEDVDSESVEILLKYVYGCETGKINEDNVEKVLIMADKYEMLDLRAVCETMLASTVTVDNAAQLLALARQRNLGTLKEVTMKFVRKNMEAVLNRSLAS